MTASPAYREHKVTFPLIKIYLLRKANLLLINKTQRPLQQPLHAVLIKHGIPLTMHQAGSRRQSMSWQYLKRPTASPVSQLPPCPASSLYFSSSHFEVLLQCPLQNKRSEKKKNNLWLLLNFLVMWTRQQWSVSPIAFPPRKYPSSLWLSRKGRNYSFSSSSLSPPRRSFISQLRGNLLQNATCIKIVEFIVSLKALAKTGWNQWKTPLMLTSELWTGGWINKDLAQAGSLIVS